MNVASLLQAESRAECSGVDFDANGSWTQSIQAITIASWRSRGAPDGIVLTFLSSSIGWLVTVGNGAHPCRIVYAFDTTAEALTACVELRPLTC